MINNFPQVLTIAGSDSDGSAGMQADLHTFFANRTYGMSVLVAAVSGNSYGITSSHLLPNDFIDEQFKVLSRDFKILATKTGMLANSSIIELVAKKIKELDLGQIVIDPVITTKHGNKLLEDSAIETIKKQLFPLAKIVTPNFYEAQILFGESFENNMDTIQKAALSIQKMGPKNVVIKGKHSGEKADITDVFLDEKQNFHYFSHDYIPTDRINGTGDTFSATIVSQLALKKNLLEAVKIAEEKTQLAIKNQIEVGHKFGPINHWSIID
ncbi:MAG: bifunctional hydroxymethylpyrimidine kinase/phosphomethylpyrimidine kinase [Lactobacillaceae bacterium]|jgi:hydroxymethylpyrimidine/phosphomethylpyrimidine kinase|nr:bifunctional hydroxymethylpyrimidine kinase/phosphomethylpyrimidine kinase [Lactobacillaceae bacterium]